MNLDDRKIEFIQEFLKLQSEEAIIRVEKIMRKEKEVNDDELFQPISHEEMNVRIDQSESDFQNGRFKSSEELLDKFK
jgi:hypothetical protein